ncbi:unnamed protein product [Ambrosiozyma monospora]|uniref:Unnamed protein product n=1 Tax=Ambrosiozyma monospora TaxID=43982 RepID=A0ACB5T7C4_AMBMO|nr:unnamed protein product [Ambrosiozyma monospora]
MSDTEEQKYAKEEYSRSPSRDEYDREMNDIDHNPSTRSGDLVPQADQPSETFNKDIKTDVVYDIPDTARYNQTRALLIANLRPPFDNSDFQQMLNEQASNVNATIERAWLNERRSHCIVIVSDVEGAAEIQKNLNGHYFPLTPDNADPEPEFDERGEPIERLKMYIDFIPVKATQLWIDQENRGPKDAVWKVDYVSAPSKEERDSTFLVATHQMLNYPNRSTGYKSSNPPRGSSRYGRGGPRRRDRGDGRRGPPFPPQGSRYRGGGPIRPSRYRGGAPPYGGYQSYPAPPMNPYYYPGAEQEGYGMPPPGYGGRGGYPPYHGQQQGASGRSFRPIRNGPGYGGDRYRSRGPPPKQEGQAPLDMDDYRRERSPMRDDDGGRGYGSRSPPANRSPEWSD